MSHELKRQLDQLDSAGLLELVVAAATRLEQLSSTVSKQQPPAEDEPEEESQNQRSGSGNATTATRRSCGRSSGAICLRRKFKKKQHWLTVVPPVRSLVAGTGLSLGCSNLVLFSLIRGSVVVTTLTCPRLVLPSRSPSLTMLACSALSVGRRRLALRR